MNIIQKPAHTSNYTVGRNHQSVELLVIHVSQSSVRSMNSWFANPAANVSAHFGISKFGIIYQYVDTNDTAWHSGRRDINQRSIGIEHEGKGDDYAPNPAQLAASAKFTADLAMRHNVIPSHETIRPHRDFRATLCPAGFPMEEYVEMVQNLTPRLKTVVLHLGSLEPVILRGEFIYTIRNDKIDIREKARR